MFLFCSNRRIINVSMMMMMMTNLCNQNETYDNTYKLQVLVAVRGSVEA